MGADATPILADERATRSIVMRGVELGPGGGARDVTGARGARR
jgi:hypothetical protein